MATHSELIQAGRDFYELREGLGFRPNPAEAPQTLRLSAIGDNVAVTEIITSPQDGGTREVDSSYSFIDVVRACAKARENVLHREELEKVQAGFFLALREDDYKKADVKLSEQQQILREARRAVVLARESTYSKMTEVTA